MEEEGRSREKTFFLSLYQYSMEDSKTLAGSVCRPCRCHRSEGLFAIFYSPIFARRLRLADDTPRSLLPSSSTDKWLHFTVLTQRLFFIQAIDSIISVDPMQTEPSPYFAHLEKENVIKWKSSFQWPNQFIR